MIDPRLQSLRLLARHGTVTAAARAGAYTPSAVSAQLRSLADEVGVPLLEQRGRRVVLTEAALTVLEHAEEVAAGWERTLAQVHEHAGQRPGSLTLCGFSTAAAGLLPPAARAVSDAFPGTHVRILETEPVECFDLLLAGDADVAVVVDTDDVPSMSDPRFTQRRLGEDPLDLLVPTGHPLTRRDTVHLREAAEESWIVDRPGRPYHRLVAAACSAAGFTLYAEHVAFEWETGAAFVQAGLGVALVPQLAHLPEVYNVVRVPLSGDPRPARTLRSAVRRGAQDHPLVAAALDATTVELRRRTGGDRAPALRSPRHREPTP